MQLCDLDDLYRKFNVIRMLQIGDTKMPNFIHSDGFSVPESELVLGLIGHL